MRFCSQKPVLKIEFEYQSTAIFITFLLPYIYSALRICITSQFLLSVKLFLLVRGDSDAEYSSTCLIPVTTNPSSSVLSVLQMKKSRLKKIK